MKNITAINGHIACRPFPANTVQVKKAGLALVAQQLELTELEVVVGNVDVLSFVTGPGPVIMAGSKVLVPGQLYTAEWAKAVMTAPGIDGPFILVPLNVIKMVVRNCESCPE